MNQTEIRYALSITGFRILASAAGIEYLPCFTESEEQEENSVETYQTELFQMVKRGLIEIYEEKYRLNKNCSDMIRTIRDRRKTLLIQGSDVEKIIYIAEENAVEATPGRKKDEYICLEFIREKDLMEYLQSVFPDSLFPEETLKEKKDTDDHPDTGEEVLRIELIGKTDQSENRYMIFSREDYLYYSDERQTQLYLKKEFIQKLIAECREEV